MAYFPLRFGVVHDGLFDLAFDPAQDRYILLWSAYNSTFVDGSFLIYGCLLDLTGLPQSECNGNKISSITMDIEAVVSTLLDDTQVPSKLVVAFAKTNGAGAEARIKSVNADLSDIDSLEATLAGHAGRWLDLIQQEENDRLITANAPLSSAGTQLYSLPLSTFPSGTVHQDQLTFPSYHSGHWQPQLLPMPGADLILVRGEVFGGDAFWSAFDSNYVSGSTPSQSSLISLPGFMTAANLTGHAERRRSVIVVNDERSFSIIGRDASSDDIVARSIVPFTTDAGITVTRLKDDIVRGETAQFHVVVNNRVPEGSIAPLAVAHEPAIRLSFSDASLVPVIDNAVCEVEADATDWLCRLSDSLAADALLEFDVAVDTSSLPAMPAQGEPIEITAHIETISTDPVADNDTAAAEIHVLPAADLVLATADGDAGFGIIGGESLALTFVITNAGSSRAQDVSLHFSLPEGISLSETGGCEPDTTAGEVVCVGIGDVMADGNASVEITLATTGVEQQTVEQVVVQVQTPTLESDVDNNVLSLLISRVPVGDEPIDPGQPNDPQDPEDPEQPPKKKGGGSLFWTLPLLALLPRRRHLH